MADYGDPNVVANRGEAIPVLRIPSHDDPPDPFSSDSEAEPGKRERLIEKAIGLQERYSGNNDDQASNEAARKDRFFDRLFSRLVPEDDSGDLDSDADAKRKEKIDRRSKKYVERPNFSLFAMNSNFRRFNARIGPAFVIQNRLIHLFTWQHPTATLSFLALYSMLCLKPHLLPVVPLIFVLFIIMIPSFQGRHPPSANDPRLEPTFGGPAISPPSRVKPAPEMSKDFMRNMRDLQNSMEDFSRIHDAANEWITPYTNFSDESLSSTLFLFLFVTSCALFIGSRLIPWRAIALVAGWVLTGLGHPNAQAVLLSSRTMATARSNFNLLGAYLRTWIEADFDTSDLSDTRQVEIFELQKYHVPSDTWEPWLFSPSPYDPLSPARIAGARAKGTQFFEDVLAPAGWAWKDKKWILDMASREWVEERMITGVEIETEGERWVYDLPREELEVLESPVGKGKGKKGKVKPRSGWEEGTGLEERGEWRRRRWIRVVERKSGGGGKEG